MSDEASPLERVAAEAQRVKRGLIRRMAGLAFKGSVRLFLGVLVVVVMGAFFVTRAHAGQVWAVAKLIDWGGAPRINGAVTVGDVRSVDLLEGVRLIDVAIRDAGGEIFARADSIDASYTLAEFLTGRISFTSLTLFQPAVQVYTPDGASRNNVSEIFRIGEGTPSEGPARQVRVTELTIVGGAVEVRRRLQSRPPPNVVTRIGEDGTVDQIIAASEIDAVVPRAILSSSDLDGMEFTVESLSMDGWYYDAPLRVDHLQGLAFVRGRRVDIEAQNLQLPNSEASGEIWIDFGAEGGLDTGFSLESPRLGLVDLHWLDERLPAAVLEGRFDLARTAGQTRFNLSGVSGSLGEDRLDVSGEVLATARGWALTDLAFDVASLEIDRLRPWFEFVIPLRGSLSGTATMDGPLSDLMTHAELLLAPPAGGFESGISVDGRMHVGDPFGVSDFRATMDPLDFGYAARTLSDSLDFGGVGTMDWTASGNLADGLRFSGEASHSVPGLRTSNVVVQGSLARREGELTFDVQADLSPLSFSSLRAYLPEIPVSGEVDGIFRARGPLSDLEITTTLDTDAGRMSWAGRVDASRTGGTYRLEGSLEGLPLSRFVPDLPEPSSVTGSVLVEGRGFSRDSASAFGSLRVGRSVVGGLDVDSAVAQFTIDAGLVALDTFHAVASGVVADGSGEVPFRADREGLLAVNFGTESLSGLQAFLIGENRIARDTLTDFDRQFLIDDGIDPDTLPLLEEFSVEGKGSGRVTIFGSWESFSLGGSAQFDDVKYAAHTARELTVGFQADGFPGAPDSVTVWATSDSLQTFGRDFSRASGAWLKRDSVGSVSVDIERTPQETYRGLVALVLDSVGGRAEVQDLRLVFETGALWELSAPGLVSWDRRAIYFDSIGLERDGTDPMSARLDGTLARRGELDARLEVNGLHLANVTRLLQWGDVDVRAHMDLAVEVTGTAGDPTIVASLGMDSLSYSNWDFARVDGTLDYEDQVGIVTLRGEREGQPVLDATGTVPIDLALTRVAERIPSDRSIDVDVVAQALPVAFAVTLMDDLEDVVGTMSGEFSIGGSVNAPVPTGTLEVEGGGWSVPALGFIRHEEVEATLQVGADGVVAVEASALSGGGVTVTGDVTLEPLTNPAFDLELAFNGFTALDRRDMVGDVSGLVHLGGTYQRPVISGLAESNRGLRLDEGELFVDEVQRDARRLDIYDPRRFAFLDLGAGQSILGPSRNPFLENLRVDVELEMASDTWLRSSELEVEIVGDLRVAYDRASRDLALAGVLEVARGSYTTLGRRFDGVSGTVDFLGTPGINPDLNIQARTSVARLDDAGPLEVLASVGGTLLSPILSLSSEEQAVAESDLLSYLAFGRPLYQLSAGQRGVVEGTTGTLGQVGLTAGFSVIAGTLTSTLNSIVSRSSWVDYFAISTSDFSPSLTAGTRIDVGRYLSNNLFGVLSLRPDRANSSNGYGGRLEWQPTDEIRMDFFVDDRFFRNGAFGFRGLGFESAPTFGWSLFRRWTY